MVSGIRHCLGLLELSGPLGSFSEASGHYRDDGSTQHHGLCWLLLEDLGCCIAEFWGPGKAFTSYYTRV